MGKYFKRLVSGALSAIMILGATPETMAESVNETGLYEKGNFVNSYNAFAVGSKNNRPWRDGMISGNGEIGYVTSGEPYSDAFIFQHIYFNYPSSDPRVIPDNLTSQLEDARENVFKLNDRWEITNADGKKRNRTYFYSFHPGAQLRLTSDYTDTAKDYIRWTNFETAENGVKFSDTRGEWVRTSFTSRPDGVIITKLTKSSQNQPVNVTVSIDDVSDMCKGYDGMSKVTEQRYKKIVPENCEYIAQMAHYPAYDGSELYDGGYGSVTLILAEGENAVKERAVSPSDEKMLVGDNASVKITNADAVYLITTVDRTFNMTGGNGDVMTAFADMDSYDLLTELKNKSQSAADKYTIKDKFSYDAALAPSAKIQKEEFNRLSFELEGDEEFAGLDNNKLIDKQKMNPNRINHEFMRRAYEQARYAMICCGGTAAPRLYGMWTGEWNPGWRGIYTLDANVNLQVSPMNTSNMGGDFQRGYITFFLRHSPDFMLNAAKAYGMHDAIQLSVNADADRAMHVEYDNWYPFEYWNAGPSWCLLPIYEYWQCFGNQQIPINDYMRFDDLKPVLGVNDGGLTDEEFETLKNRGYLDLEKDILLPLLTKQANFWEQLVTPRYYIDADGNACHNENKTALNEGEKYMIIPGYSPENHPIGYSSTITANATMDIAAARDGLDMACAIEKAVKREGWEEAVAKWTNLKNSISDYKFDSDGALKEWAMSEYEENNNHRHLSHLYPAWPAYETQTNTELAKAANIALDNRNKYNTTDATAGHGWMHKALVEARLKRGDGMMKSLLKMMNGSAYYSSMMTDHDTNRRNDTYCTDSTFGMMSAVNEALAFSNTGEIELIPALPKDWKKGGVKGLMARTRVEISDLSWDFDNSYAKATLTSLEDNNKIRLSCGETWTSAAIDGEPLKIREDARGNYVEVTLNKNKPVSVEFAIEVDTSVPQEIIPAVTATGENPQYAVDKDVNTVYTVANQTADTIANQYIQFEFNGTDNINKIVIKKAILPGESNYWADWALAVGCELQGSLDGNAWETIAEMNPKPDGTDNISEAEFDLTNPKPYKYVRYIRARLQSADYDLSWKFKGDSGNRLSLADIEFYTNKPMEESAPGNPLSGSYDANSSTYTWTFNDEAADIDTSLSRSYETKDKIVDLRLILRSGDYVHKDEGIHFNDKSVGDSGSIQGSRYILIKPARDGTLSAAMSFAGAKNNVKCRLYAYDYGEADSFDSIDETLAVKGGTMQTAPDITDESTAERTLELEGGHTYALYTYQRASNIYALSYKVTEETAPDVTVPPEPETAPWIDAEIISAATDGIRVRAQSNASGEYKMITAVYSENGALLGVKTQPEIFEKDVPREINTDMEINGNVYVFFWKDKMTPVSDKIGI